MASEEQSGFLSRWARRKGQVRAGESVVTEPVAVALPTTPSAPVAPVAASSAASMPAAVEAPPEPLPTLADVAGLTRESDYSRFVATGVDEGVKRAAMKKLFTDPHFNVMDGLDTYIDDYGKPDPIPLAMLRSMNQSKVLRLFDDDEDEKNADRLTAANTTETAEAPSPSDDDPDLRLQQDHAAGRPSPDQGAGA
jgi:hypothetical protein